MKTHLKKLTITNLIFLLILCCLFAVSNVCVALGEEVSPPWYISSSISNSTTGVAFSREYFAELTASVSIYDTSLDKTDENVLKVFAEIDALLLEIESISHPMLETSEISQFNAMKSGQTMKISNQLAQMVTIAQQMYTVTDGAFDPSAYRLVDLWGFSSRTYGSDGNLPYDRNWDSELISSQWGGYRRFWYPLPQTKYIEAFKQLCDFNSVVLSGTEDDFYLTKNCPSVTVDGETYEQWIDLGGIAKGYAVEKIETILQQFGYPNYLINFGQSSLAMTTYQNCDGFDISFQNPDEIFSAYASINLKNTALSTSGTYVRQYEVNGKQYSHIIDPKTGYPVDTNIVSVSIFGGGAGYDDCLTTALTVLGREGTIDFMNSQFCRQNDLKIMALFKDTRTFAAKIQVLTNIDAENYKIADGIVLATRFLTAIDADGNTYLAVQYVETLDYKTILIVMAVVVGVVLFGLSIFKFIKNRKAQKTQKIIDLKQDKFFKLGDIAVYAVVVVLIVVLLAVYVFGATKDEIKIVKIQSILTGETLFTLNMKTGEYSTFESETYTVKVTETGDTIEVIVEIEIDGHYHFNQVTISRQSGNMYAKMTDAICGTHKECVNTFPAITTANGVIVCTPNGLKVTTAEDSNYILV